MVGGGELDVDVKVKVKEKGKGKEIRVHTGFHGLVVFGVGFIG